MDKPKKLILFFVIASLILIAILYGILSYKQSNNVNDLGDVLYYGVTCPHCKLVEAFISENNITQKVQFEQKEVYENKTNAQELIKIGKKCNIASDYIGAVPLLYLNKKCYVGDVDIIQVLNETALRAKVF